MSHPTDAGAEPLNTDRINLDRHYVDPSVGERDRDRSESCADLHDQLTRPEVGLGDQAISELRTKEVLTETAASLVPGCPPVCGHDGSPS
jgi:hypothetical protein